MTTSKSETPLTDAEEYEGYTSTHSEATPWPVVDASFARKLETMLSLAEGAITNARDKIETARKTPMDYDAAIELVFDAESELHNTLAKISELKATL